MTFLATWGYANYFFKDATKIQMAARGQLQHILYVQKLQNLKSEIIQILQSRSPRYGDVQVIF